MAGTGIAQLVEKDLKREQAFRTCIIGQESEVACVGQKSLNALISSIFGSKRLLDCEVTHDRAGREPTVLELLLKGVEGGDLGDGKLKSGGVSCPSERRISRRKLPHLCQLDVLGGVVAFGQSILVRVCDQLSARAALGRST